MPCVRLKLFKKSRRAYIFTTLRQSSGYKPLKGDWYLAFCEIRTEINLSIAKTTATTFYLNAKTMINDQETKNDEPEQ